MPDFYTWLSVCSQNMGGQLKICTSYLGYSQIWLHLPWDDSHFSLHFPMDNSHYFGYKQKFLQKENTNYYPSGKNLPKKNRVELRAWNCHKFTQQEPENLHKKKHCLKLEFLLCHKFYTKSQKTCIKEKKIK